MMKRVSQELRDKWGFRSLSVGKEVFHPWENRREIKSAKCYYEKITKNKYTTFKSSNGVTFFIGIKRLK